MRIAFAVSILLAIAVAVTGASSQWRAAAPGYEWEFPRDLAAHPDYKTEWWYVTGNLATDDGAEPLAFQLTFFRVGLARTEGDSAGSAWAADDLVMAHAAVTDPDGAGHRFSEVIRRTTPFLGGFGAPGDTVLAWCRAPAGTDADWRIGFVDGAWLLSARDDRHGLRFELRCEPEKPRVFHGDGGFSPKSADGDEGSLYFSRTRMRTTGTVYRAGRPLAVRGSSWLDREIFTNTLADGQEGWDWLALQLDDGRDLMLYRLRGADPADDFSLGTLVAPDGTATTLPDSAWSLVPQDRWTSPETGSRYPVRWRLQVPRADIDCTLEALIPEQENVSAQTGIHYWEGAVRARAEGGRIIGRGFVELTGYGEGSRPPV